MTRGTWICIDCGNKIELFNISFAPTKCEKCGTEYEFIETIKPHMSHTVDIMKSKKSGKLCVVRASALTFSSDTVKKEDIEKYFKIRSESNE